MRILIVTNMWPAPEQPARGVFVQRQVEALRRTGQVEVTVAAFSATGRPWEYLRQAIVLRRRKAEADLVHAHFGLSALTALGAIWDGQPLVLTVHGRDCHHPVTRAVTRAVAQRCAAVVAVSRELAAICPFPTMDIIPAGVDTHHFQPCSRQEARARLHITASERFVLFPSDPARSEKRYDRARALVTSLPGLDLRSYHHTPPQETPLWIAAADAVLVTSDREGYGLACMEALACNVPVLSTPVGIAPEVLPRVPGTLCAPFSVSTWRQELQRILADPDPHVPGREAALEHSTDAMARRTVVLYREVLRRAGREESCSAEA